MRISRGQKNKNISSGDELPNGSKGVRNREVLRSLSGGRPAVAGRPGMEWFIDVEERNRGNLGPFLKDRVVVLEY